MLSKVCKLILTIGIYWIICTKINAQAQTSQSSFRFRNFTTDDGLPNGYTTSIRTDSLGYVWCLYADRLCRFDGYNFKIFQYDEHNPSRSALNFNSDNLLKDATGNIWLRQQFNGSKPPFTLAKYDWKLDKFNKYEIKGQRFLAPIAFEKDNSAIWAGRGKGNGLLMFDFESGEADLFMNPSGDSINVKLHNTIGSIMIYDSHLLLGTARGLWIFDKKSHLFSRPPSDPKDSTFLYHSPIGWLIKLKNPKETKSIWFRTGESIVKIDSTFSILKRAEKMKSGIRSLDTDHEAVWFRFAEEKGLFHYNLDLDSLFNIQAEPGNKFSLQSNAIKEITVDRDNSVWIATQQGISHLRRRSINYHNVDLPDLHSSILYNAGEKEYLIWNQGEKFLSAPLEKNLDLKSGLKETVLSLKGAIVSGFWKGKKYLWASMVSVAPDGAGGVFGFPINPKTKMVEDSPLIHLDVEPDNANKIARQMCNDVWESGNGDVWVAHATGGLSRVDLNVPYGSQGSVTRYIHIDGDTNSIVSNVAFAFFPEDTNSVWVTTLDGVDLLHFDENKNVTFEHVFTKRELADVLFRTNDGNLFLGTTNGLYQATRKSGRYRFNHLALLGKRSFNSIHEDQLGRLWLKTNGTLICFDRQKEVFIEFDVKDGIDHLRSLELGRLESHDFMHRTKNGLLLLTDPDGATLFDPLSFKVDTTAILPVLTNLLINNLAPEISDNPDKSEKYTIPNHVGALSELVLDYKHNNFTIEFSAMDMTAPEKNRYRHKLENYDLDWIESDFKNRTATYTNLDPGKYIFKVRASNHHGVWSDQETVLSIRILPPLWRTWWAYSLYGAASLGLLLTWRNYENKRLKLKHRAEHLSELDTLKTKFYTNISHEFRTPITLILGPLKEMYNKANTSDDRSAFNMMIKNGQRLLHLINQLLDLNKLEAGKMVLRATPLDVVQFLKEIASSYESWASDKKIEYTFDSEVLELRVYLDPEKIEKIIHNLLSNAFKFTPEGGKVLIHLRIPAKEWLQIIVKDSGIGILPHQHEEIFGRFYQIDSSKTREYEGSGLGMAIAKELVEIHHGKISVESTIGMGTTFTVNLPIDKKYFLENEILENSELPLSITSANTGIFVDESETEQQEVNSNGSLPVLLIVEDNGDMRRFIRRILVESYQIIEAVNGRDGLSKAEGAVPDLIISDVMMPEMDGYELCERIKTNELTSHIPVILLTAKADRASKLTGLQTRADDYLSKPFDADELKLIVRNRVEEIRRLRDRFSREVTLEPTKIAITSLDEKFLSRVMSIIEVHLDDELFSIDELAKEVGYSNMHFYRKIKALAGQSPSVFLRTIRLKRAAKLLEKNSDNVTQIAYGVGFSSLPYFIKCFKDQFGVTPGQYAETQALRHL